GSAATAEAESFKALLANTGASTADVLATIDQARDLARRGAAASAFLHARFDRLAGQIDEVRGRLAPDRLRRLAEVLTELDANVARLRELLAQTDAVIALVKRGDGSLAAFMEDVELADEVKDLTKIMKQQPWKMSRPGMHGAAVSP